jgi:hypothetical protein
MALDKLAILDIARLGIREVTLAADRGTVFVRGLTLREYDGFETAITEAKRRGLTTVRAELLVRTLCDESGARLFSDEDTEALAALGQDVLEPAFQAAAKLSGLTEDVGKNSPSGPGGGSSSGSPTASPAP